MAGTSLSELLKTPFGPYLEEEVLIETCRGTTKNNPVSLNLLTLGCGGLMTGLNECESTQPDYDADRFSDTPIVFRGILEIQSLSWLQPDALNTIEEELRERDVAARSPFGVRASPSNLTLKRIYSPVPGFTGAQLRVKVKIQGVKHMPAVYLHGDHVPDGLMITSQAHKRRYAVESLDIETYKRSDLYLARFRLMRTLKDLLKLDGECNHHADNTTPMHLRNPTWFVDLYMRHMAQAGEARHWRPVFDAELDPDVGPNGRMRGNREHILRHVSRAEVCSLFAAHAEWVVGDLELGRAQWLDLESWRAWITEIARTRKLAAREGYSWGVPPGVQVSPEEEEEEEEDLPSRLRSRIEQQGKKTKQRRAPRRNASRTTGSGATTSTMRSADPPSHGPSRRRTPSPEVDDTYLRTYDPDFSPVSTPPGSPSSASSIGLPSRPASPIDPNLAALIPSAYFHPPQPTATLKWVCEIEGCGYLIDLLRLTDANIDLAGDLITPDERLRLKGKSWHIRESWARDAFGYMVSAHREEHMESWGFKVVIEGKESKLVYTHRDGTHVRSDQLRKVKKDNRRPVIKEEDR
ncbi:uncharacterized protein TRAVEDRAFT_68417 [Trametes versicolor FP-101664 SS1]|uniref:uncharacterized protein n=1 Tax=Trametes versicolor (strain FP-101664) TaxID=717944 RepID=UPI0004623707|nr:uncharacterized protein TRAVEDRAFT_68417 [Trametes versicolor FP-101664 SS1]EIW64656.1 hypothetical protein TRAVEDRAFT_68417 [Trametes versicolor FP-101664 SS1]